MEDKLPDKECSICKKLFYKLIKGKCKNCYMRMYMEARRLNKIAVEAAGLNVESKASENGKV